MGQTPRLEEVSATQALFLELLTRWEEETRTGADDLIPAQMGPAPCETGPQLIIKV